ncbi:MAG: hypothetical protein ACYCZ0_00035 [Minisyncoccota bacterium]
MGGVKYAKTHPADDLVKRLRHLAKLLGTGHFDIPAHLIEAADALVAAHATIKKMQADLYLTRNDLENARDQYDQLYASVTDVDEAWRTSASSSPDAQTVIDEMIAVATGEYEGYEETLDPWTCDNRVQIDGWQVRLRALKSTTPASLGEVG